jgi:hypothetical protein
LLLHCFGFSHFKVVHETADPFEMIEPQTAAMS